MKRIGTSLLAAAAVLGVAVSAVTISTRPAQAQAPDPFDTQQPGLSSPASNAFAITPSDSTDLAVAARALYVGTGGTVVVRLRATGTTAVTFKNVPSGSVLPVRAVRVLATGTTAADLVGLN